MGKTGAEMATKPVELDKRTNAANAVNEAAQWINLAMETDDRARRQIYMITALRWLESTGVTDTAIPSIESIRR